MIVSEIFYGVKCNRCGEQYEDGEHSFWSDEDNAIETQWNPNGFKKRKTLLYRML